MPAPVMTTTFRDFHSQLEISCSSLSELGITWVVGMFGETKKERKQADRQQNKSGGLPNYRVMAEAKEECCRSVANWREGKLSL